LLEVIEEVKKKNLAVGVPIIMIATEGNEKLVYRAISARRQGLLLQAVQHRPDQDQRSSTAECGRG
jgi:hypothetical protein